MSEVIKFNDPPKKIDSGMGKIITHDKCKAECQHVIAEIFREIEKHYDNTEGYAPAYLILESDFEKFKAKYVKGE